MNEKTQKTQKTLKTLANVLSLVGALGLVVVLARVLLDSRSFPVAFIDRAPLIAAWFTAIAVGEGSTLRVAPELSDPVGSLEVGEHEDVEQLGAGSRAESV